MRSSLGNSLLVFLLLALPAGGKAAEGELDPNFGINGIVSIDVNGLDDRAHAMAVQTDGKILLTGYSNNGSNYDIALLRYHSDGSLDTSFNATGSVTTDVATLNEAAYSVAIQTDGKILVGGYSELNYHAQMALLRYHSDGSLDTSFNATGIVTTDIGSSHEYGQGLTIQPDGKILLVGYSDNGSDNDLALVRYNSDGSLDTSFNTTGIVTLDIGGSNDLGRSIALQTDGKILVAGYSNIAGNNDMALVRFNSDGSLDTSFNTTGIVTTNVGSGDNAYSVAIQPDPDGKILLGGYSYIGNYSQVTLLRYNSDGSLDTSFNSAGIVTTDINGFYDYALSIAIQPDSKILVGGYSDNGSKNDMAVLRYNDDGSLDTSFDSDGIVTTNIGGLNDGAYSVALQPDGNILLAGYSNIAGNYDVALVRYQGTSISAYSVTPAAAPNGSLSPNSVQLVPPGETTSFSITPDPGYQLDSISGCGGSLVDTTYTTAPATQDCTVTASFSLLTHMLSLTVSGLGTVHSTPAPDMQCTANCSQDFTAGTLVTLTAAPALDYSFSGWTGDCTGTGDCQLTMDSAQNVSATFSANASNPVLLESTQGTYLTMQSAYDSIPASQADSIKVKAGEQAPENLFFDRDVTISLQGGYDDSFVNTTSTMTSFSGSLTISGSPVTVTNLVIK